MLAEIFDGGGGVDTLGRILFSVLLLMTRLRKAEIHTFVSEERKLYHNSMSSIPQKLIASYSIRGPAVLRARDRSFEMGSIHGGSRSHLTFRGVLRNLKRGKGRGRNFLFPFPLKISVKTKKEKKVFTSRCPVSTCFHHCTAYWRYVSAYISAGGGTTPAASLDRLRP